jgi:hypothetical protein
MEDDQPQGEDHLAKEARYHLRTHHHRAESDAVDAEQGEREAGPTGSNNRPSSTTSNAYSTPPAIVIESAAPAWP